MFCGKCGNQLKDGARFCGKCGNPVKVIMPVVNEPVIMPREIKVPEKPVVIPEEVKVPERPVVVPEEVKIPEEPVVVPEEVKIPEEPVVIPEEINIPEAPESVMDQLDEFVEPEEFIPEQMASEPAMDFEEYVPGMPEEVEKPVEDIPEFIMPDSQPVANEAPVYEETPVYNETPAYEEPVVERPVFEEPVTPVTPVVPVNQPVYNETYTNGADDSQRTQFTQSDYVTADVPVEPEKKVKKKKKRPIIVSIICGFFTFILTIVLFVLTFGLFVRTVYDGAKAQSNGAALYSGVNYVEAPIGSFINQIDKSADLDEDASLSDYIYEKLPADDKKNTSADEIAKELRDANIEGFVMDIINDVTKGVSGKKNGPALTNDMILDKIEDNEKVFEAILGRELKDSDYKEIEKQLDKLELEKNTTFKDGDLEVIEENPALQVLVKVVTDPFTAYALFGISIAVVLILIILLNLHKPYKFLGHAGTSAVVTGAIGITLAFTFDLIIKEFSKELGFGKAIVDMMFDGLKNVMTINAIIFIGVGFVFIILNIIFGVISKAKQRKAYA